MAKRSQRTYDHRLRDLVRYSGDPDIVAAFGVPRSTALGWLRGEYQTVVTDDLLDMDQVELQREVLNLRQRIQKLASIIRLLVVLLRVLNVRLDGNRLPEGTAKTRLLRAIDRAQDDLSLLGALRVLGMSPSRYHRWRRAESQCGLDDQPSCPRSTPSRLTPDEILTIKAMVESPDYRHVSTGQLAMLAQRLGNVFAAPTTWYRLVRERGWCRPRKRIHPAKPKDGVRATAPYEIWHVDTTLVKLLDNTKIYIHAVIDNYSRKILAWCVAEKFELANQLVANAVMLQNVADQTRAIHDLHEGGYPVRIEDLAFLSPLVTWNLRRFGKYSTRHEAEPIPEDKRLPR